MKKAGYQRRRYQDRYSAQGLRAHRVALKETEVCVLTSAPVPEAYLSTRVRHYRSQIESYIEKDRRFLTALKPLPVDPAAPAIVQSMCRAARKAGVGPMAAVAGAVAQFLAKDLMRKRHREIIIENGGDIVLLSRSPRLIGIYSGDRKPWRRLKMRVSPQSTPLGICTSSGTVGHSLSFGSADSVVIMAKDAPLADAVATATANRVKRADDLAGALHFARGIRGVRAVIILFKNKMVSWGDVEFAA